MVVALLVFGRLALPRLFAQAARTKSPELFLAASLLVVILAASPPRGRPVADRRRADRRAAIAETEYHGEVESIIEPFKGLALGVFLITVGMSIDLAMVGAIWLAARGDIAVLVLKALVTGLLLRMMGARPGTAAETGILMASPSETTLIVLAAAASAQLIAPATEQFWQSVTAIGMMVTPLLALAGRRLAREVEPAHAMPPQPEVADAPRAIIVGFGRVGQLVAEMLVAHGRAYVGVDSDADLVAEGLRRGYLVHFGNAARGEALDRLGAGNASAVILTMDEPIIAHRLVRKLRGQYPELPIVARARDAIHAAALYRAGATHAVPETLESSLQLSEAVLVEIGVAMGRVIASIHEKRDQLRDQIMEQGELDYRPQLRILDTAGAGLAGHAYHHSTRSPGSMPSCAARPPFSSSTAPVSPPARICASLNGTALAAIDIIRPSTPMKMMSSGSGVSRIQKLAKRGGCIGKIIPSSAPIEFRNISPRDCSRGLRATSTRKWKRCAPWLMVSGTTGSPESGWTEACDARAEAAPSDAAGEHAASANASAVTTPRSRIKSPPPPLRHRRFAPIPRPPRRWAHRPIRARCRADVRRAALPPAAFRGGRGRMAPCRMARSRASSPAPAPRAAPPRPGVAAPSAARRRFPPRRAPDQPALPHSRAAAARRAAPAHRRHRRRSRTRTAAPPARPAPAPPRPASRVRAARRRYASSRARVVANRAT